MSLLPTLLLVSHLIGLALELGAATIKMVLVLLCRANPAMLPAYVRVAKPITRQIVLGMIILTLSGVGWLLIGYEFSTLLIVKIILVGCMLALGPIIDNSVEPKFHRLAPAPNREPTPEFHKVQFQHLSLEVASTVLFYVIFELGVSL